MSLLRGVRDASETVGRGWKWGFDLFERERSGEKGRKVFVTRDIQKVTERWDDDRAYVGEPGMDFELV